MPYKKDYIVYGLVDPRTLLIRYIGKSTIGLGRPRAHRFPERRTTGPHCSNWISELKATGLMFEIVVLDRLSDATDLSETERWWIAYGKLSQWPLTNLTEGGDGICNPPPEVRAKISARFKGVSPSPETRAKISAALTGKTLSKETREKIGKASKGRKWKPETFERFKEARAGYHHSPETRAKIAEGNKRRVENGYKRVGYVHSLKTRSKISVGNRKAWARKLQKS